MVWSIAIIIVLVITLVICVVYIKHLQRKNAFLQQRYKRYQSHSRLMKPIILYLSRCYQRGYALSDEGFRMFLEGSDTDYDALMGEIVDWQQQYMMTHEQ